jgi:hypothetical protein
MLKKLIASLFLGISLVVFPTVVFGDSGTINQLAQWITSGGYIKVASSTAGIWIPSLGSASKCLITDASGHVSTQTCSSGGGSSGGSLGWIWNGINSLYNSTSTDDVLIGGTATTTNAKLEVQGGIFASASSTIGNGTQTGGLTINGGATSTNGMFFNYVNSNANPPMIKMGAQNSGITIGSGDSLGISMPISGAEIYRFRNSEMRLGVPIVWSSGCCGSLGDSFLYRGAVNTLKLGSSASLADGTLQLGSILATGSSTASSTIGNGTQTGGLTINGTASTTALQVGPTFLSQGGGGVGQINASGNIYSATSFNIPGLTTLSLASLYSVNNPFSFLGWNGSAQVTLFKYLNNNSANLMAQLPIGFLSSASSTIGDGTQAGGLTVNGGATTTGNQYISGTLGIGTQPTAVKVTLNGGLQVIGNNTITFGNTSGYNALNIFDNGATNRYGWGINAAEIQSYIPVGSHWSWNSGGTLQTSGINEVMRLTASGNLGIGTTSPYSMLSIHANNGGTNTTLFAIASSTAVSTTTLFSVNNTGSTTASNGFNISAGCYAIGGVCLSNGTTYTGTYPIQVSGSVISSALSTTTSQNWTGSNTFLGSTAGSVYNALNLQNTQSSGGSGVSLSLLSGGGWNTIMSQVTGTGFIINSIYDTIFQANGVEKMRLIGNGTFSGNLGIGTTSPYSKLSVMGQIVADNLVATSTTAITSLQQTTMTNATSTNATTTGAQYDNTLTIGTLSGLLKGISGAVTTATLGVDYVNGSGTSGNCVKWGASNALADQGAPCGSGGGGSVSNLFSTLTNFGTTTSATTTPLWLATNLYASGTINSVGTTTIWNALGTASTSISANNGTSTFGGGGIDIVNGGCIAINHICVINNVANSASSTLLSDFNTWSGWNTFARSTTTQATSTNFFSSIFTATLGTFTNLLATNATTTNEAVASSTIQNLFAQTSTTTSATTTTSFASIASSTNLFAQQANIGALTVSSCTGCGGGGSSVGGTGAVQFANGASFNGDASNFFWDNTNKRLGLGTNAPSETLDMVGTFGLMNSAGNADYFNINSIGQVAVGTSTGQSQLHGDLNYAMLTVQGQYGSTTPLFNIATTTSAGYATSSLFTVLANGNTGFGTSSPFAKLSVQVTGTSTSLGVFAPLFVISSSTLGLATSTPVLVDYLGNLTLTGGSTTLRNFTAINSTSTGATSTSLGITGVVSALHLAGATGGVSAYAGTSCTNQFNRSLSAVGAATCASVATTDMAAIAANSLVMNRTSASAVPTVLATSTIFSGTVGQVGYFSGTGALVGTSTVVISTASRVGIGTTTPWRTLSASGTVAFLGLTVSSAGNAVCINTTKDIEDAGAASCVVSTRKAKHDIQPIGGALDEIMKLRPVSYTYNDTGVKRYGFIAEEVALIDPKLIEYAPSDVHVTGEDGKPVLIPKGDPYTVDYVRAVGLVTASIQDLNKKVDALQVGKVARSAEENWQWYFMLALLGLIGIQQVQINRLRK